MKHKKIIYSIILILFIILFLYLSPNLFGSYTDWINQHSVFPEYFRQLFYETHDIFPDFALNIGAGQNIYNFAYYGFLNPFILLSYFLPFVSMTNYLMFINIVIIFLSVYLFYIFLKDKVPKNIAIFTSILLILSGPFIFQLHRHFMFINYMPFLILSLIGVDKYFDKNKSGLLIISTFLIILTSFYYSIGSILVIVIYGIYKYLSKNEFQFKKFIIDGLKFLKPIIISVLMSSILIVPTFLTLIGGRGSNNFSIDLLIPDFNLDRILYGNYVIGVSSFIVIAFYYLFKSKKKENIIISVITLICLLFPIITYILNGTLYTRSKALIPFIPLLYLIISKATKYILKDKTNLKNLYIFVLTSSILFYILGYTQIYYYIEILFITLLITIYHYKKNIYIILVPILIISFITCIGINYDENYVSKDLYNELFSKNDYQLIENIQKQDTSFYRMNNLKNMDRVMNKVYNINYFQTSLYSSAYNQNYYDLVYDVESLPYRNNLMQVSTEDILFQSLMGVKYVVTDYKLGNGYTLIDQLNNTYLYQNNYALGLGYVNNNLMSKSYYDKLSYPYNLEALKNYIVVDKDVDTNYQTNITKLDYNYELLDKTNLDIEYVDNTYKINSNNGNLKLKLNNDSTKNLIIKFKLNNESKCSKGDISIDVNNIRNKLTCSSWIYYNDNHDFNYVVSNTDTLDIKFSKGYFEISDIEIYELDLKKSNYTQLNINKSLTKGDNIVGNINVSEKSFFTLTIPFDKGFTIKVNNDKIDYYKVNEAFIGFEIDKGDNLIEITYKAPGKTLGNILTITGVILFIVEMYKEKKNGSSSKKPIQS